MRYLLSTAVMVAISGCQTIWVHPNKSGSEYQGEAYQCERDTAAVQNIERANDMWNRCMRVKGWRSK